MSDLYIETVIRTPRWWLVQIGDQLVDPPVEDCPDPRAFGRGDSITGTHAVLYEDGKVVRAWEDSDRLRWNGRACTHGIGLDCDQCKGELREEKMRTSMPTVEPIPTVDPAGAGTMEAAGIEPALHADRKGED